MKLIRKSLVLILTVALITTMMPVGTSFVFAAENNASAGGDAFAAIGIDTSVAPEGYDENSIDNPYGRDTIKVNTVSELYTVGLNKDVSTLNADEYDAGSGSESAKQQVSSKNNTVSGSMQSALYGNGSGLSSISAALRKVTNGTISTGNIKAASSYVKLNTGTHSYDSSNGTYGSYTYIDRKTGLTLAESEQGVMSDVAAGNFDKNKEGKSAQIAMVYTKKYSADGGLYLKFGDATGSDSNAYGNTSIELLSQSKKLGNPDLKVENEDGTPSDKNAENFLENPYQMKNYLQVAAGDWNGDGIDEVAVYIPEENNSRISIFALQRTENSAYKNAANWSLAWTYYLKEDNVVSNMISMTSGDVDRDGIDDLACTWGYYYGPSQNKGSKAVVMFGGKGKELLKRSQQFDVSFGSSNIVRASFTYGDIGTGEESLILCGQSDADLKEGNTYSRYVAMYTWDGKKFAANVEKNFNLFEESDGSLVYQAMSRDKGNGRYMFYSLPLCPANTAIITKGISDDGGNKLYFDSLIFAYTDEGLELSQAWDMASFMPGNNKKEYVEYDGVAGDLTGQTGAGALMTVTQTMSAGEKKTETYREEGPQDVVRYKQEAYYKNWFYKLLRIKSYRWVYSHTEKITQGADINQTYSCIDWGETKMVIACPSENNYSNVSEVNSSFSLCLANTDNDSSYMNYAGTHYYRYSDPKVLAVLASPPYFKDLLGRGDLSGNYAESTTSYSSTTGSESGSKTSSTISVGAYVSFEQEFSVFGVKIGQVEAEAVVKSGFTYETEKTSSLEQTISYSATSGEDKVALYSIPMEIYQYESYVPDANGVYEKVITEVNIPHEACVKLLDLSEYEMIAEDYSILPAVSENVLRHEIGDPSTYPTSTAGYSVVAEYNGTPASVGYTSKDGGDTIAQEIAMSTSKGNSYSYSAGVEAKAGAGAGGVTVGVIAGAEAGGGTVSISTEGSSFSGELQAMPVEAKPYGYAMNWKIFCYKYKGTDMEFPVVSYLVSEVQQPAPLPEDFQQNVAETTEDSVTLTWTYDKYVSGFQIYRYYEFPDGSGSYRLEYIPFSKGVKKGDKFEFSYTDKGLSPYTEYKYQIQTESTYNPKVSIYSEPITCRTKTTVGYPQMTISGLIEDGSDAGKLAIFPDSEGKAKVTVADEEKYKSLSYQWQKYVNSEWVNLPAYKTNELTISNASAADKGYYRCRVNAIYFDETSQKEFSISAFTQTLETVYSKRTPEAVLTIKADKYGTNKDINGIHAEIEFHSANIGNTTAPKGNVTFTIEGKDYENTRTAALVPSTTTKSFDMGNGKTENKYYSNASIDVEGLAEGTYTVKYYYSGDSVFKDKTLEIGQIVAVGRSNGYVLNLKDKDGHVSTRFTYGDTIKPILYTVSAGSSNTTEVESGVTYKYQQVKNSTPSDFNPETTKLNAGQYTLFAYKDGNPEPVASAELKVEKKALTVSAVAMDNVELVSSKPPQLVTSVDGVTPESLDVTYKAYNSAGNEMTLSDKTDPGNYTITPCFMEKTSEEIAASEAKRANYEISFESAVYTIIGQTYSLTVSAEKYQDKFSELKDVGTAAISSTGLTSGTFVKETDIQLYAVPDEGYEVEKWTVNTVGYPEETYTAESMKAAGQNPNRLNIKMKPGETAIKVYFKVKETRLSLIDTEGGSVSCASDEYFESGAIVSRGAEFTFKATPQTGYSFGQWVVSETGFSSVYNKGTVAEDGTSSIDIVVGTNDIGLQATFVRDSYTVNLEGDIVAYYYKEGSDSTAAKEKIYITDGKSVKGDTKIYVEPKTGYVAAEDAFITVNGSATGQASLYSFDLIENTVISLNTVRERYSVTALSEPDTNGNICGTVVITADGSEVKSGDYVDGNSKVAFKAFAERGYVFDHWIIGENMDSTADEYVIPEIGKPVSVTAVFRENAKHTFKGGNSPENRGKLVYTLYDIYGNIVEENHEFTTAIDMYKGESIEISAVPNGGSMVEQWILNENGQETKYVSAAKKYPGGIITMNDSDIEIQAVLVSSTSYDLYFHGAATGEGEAVGGSVTATADGATVATGDKIPGGADVIFTAAPDSGKMVDHWAVTKGDASVTPTEENTITVKDSEGNVLVDPVYEIDGFRGNQTVRVYFKDRVTKKLTITGSNAVTQFTYVTPVTASDSISSSATFADVRTEGTVKLSLTPKDGYATSLAEVKKAFSGYSEQVTVKYENGSYDIILKNPIEEKTVNVNDFVDQLWNVTASENNGNCTVGKISASKTADGAAEGYVRNGSDVTFTLTPDSGYGTSIADIESMLASYSPSVTKNGEGYSVTLRSISKDAELDFTTCMDKLYKVSMGSTCTMTGFTSSITCETAPAGFARKGANVSFTLVPGEGYRLNKSAITTWKETVEAAGMTLLTNENEDKSLVVDITNLQDDITVPDNLFTPIPSGGGALPVPPEDEMVDEDNKISAEETVNDSGQKITTIAVEAAAVINEESGSLEIKMTKEQQDILLKTAIDRNAAEIVIKAGELKDDSEKAPETVNVSISADLAAEILEKTDAVLKVETPNGNATLDQKALTAVSEQLGKETEMCLSMMIDQTNKYQNIIGETGQIIVMNLTAGEKQISDFGEGKVQLKFEIPNTLAGRDIVAVYISEDGELETFKGEILTEKVMDENGKEREIKYYSFDTNHFSVYALAEKETVEAYDNVQKIISGVKNTKARFASSKVYKNSIRLTFKKPAADVDGYKIYMATKKNGVYKWVGTTTTNTFTKKKLKKGTSYYFKVKAYKVVDGKTVYTQISGKLCKKTAK